MSDYGDQKIEDILQQCLKFIESAKISKGKVLVHWYVSTRRLWVSRCAFVILRIFSRGGVNRSPTIVLAYLLDKEKYTLQDAFRLLKTRYGFPTHNSLRLPFGTI
jgi:hypothetical protein